MKSGSKTPNGVQTKGKDGIKDVIYDHGTIKVVIFACVVIVLSVVFTGIISYTITRSAVVDKLKARDLVYIMTSIASKIDGRIERAKETSLLLATDPSITAWVAGGETDEQLGKYAKTEIDNVAERYDYKNSFIVSAITGHYWAEGSRLIQTVSKTSSDDQWFFATLQSGKAVSLNIDYNPNRQDTFVFVNALLGPPGQPIGVTGIGLSLKEFSQEFQNNKYGEKSNLWLVDNEGKIHLSDNFGHNGQNIRDFIPQAVFDRIMQDYANTVSGPQVMEYTDAGGQTIDLAYQSTRSTDWKLVFQMPRSESIAILGGIRTNTGVAGLVSILVMTFVFYVVSRRIANPLKRAIALTREMEAQVEERTQELADKNQKLMDSIDYAKMLQESVLPTAEEMKETLKDHFLLWRPRDIVGGDFYWVRRLPDGRKLVAIADCTGHGVPGAFMTMALNSTLKYIVDGQYTEPAEILSELNRRMKEILHRNAKNRVIDDGLDIGLCCIDDTKIVYAGAKISLYIYRNKEIHCLQGDRKSIGYRRSSDDLIFTRHTWDAQPGDRFYLSTDGYIDQNGGSRNFPMGRKRFLQVIAEQGTVEISGQAEAFELALQNYRGEEPQRDDITLLGFSLA